MRLVKRLLLLGLLLAATLPLGSCGRAVERARERIRLEAVESVRRLGFSGAEDPRTVGQALQQFPLAFALATADMEATYFLEREEG